MCRISCVASRLPTALRASPSSSAGTSIARRQSVVRTRSRRLKSPRPPPKPGKRDGQSESRCCMPTEERLTMAQALIAFLQAQYVVRDEAENPFFAGCFGIFGHGNLAGIGQALQQSGRLRYYQSRNEQAQVHIASGYAKMHNRLRAMACTSSIGPGATNMLTGAATATINRLPVLLLPGDSFARRNVAPVLQQLEQMSSQDISVHDCFKPVSRYWDRINRPDQIITALPEAMRVLTSQVDTGTVTLAL